MRRRLLVCINFVSVNLSHCSAAAKIVSETFCRQWILSKNGINTEKLLNFVNEKRTRRLYPGLGHRLLAYLKIFFSPSLSNWILFDEL